MINSIRWFVVGMEDGSYSDVVIFPVTVQIPFSCSNPPSEDTAMTVESLIWHREFHRACACGGSVG